jgi:hypothetical protein
MAVLETVLLEHRRWLCWNTGDGSVRDSSVGTPVMVVLEYWWLCKRQFCWNTGDGCVGILGMALLETVLLEHRRWLRWNTGDGSVRDSSVGTPEMAVLEYWRWLC